MGGGGGDRVAHHAEARMIADRETFINIGGLDRPPIRTPIRTAPKPKCPRAPTIRQNWGPDRTAPHDTEAAMISKHGTWDKNWGRRNRSEAEMIPERGTFHKNGAGQSDPEPK